MKMLEAGARAMLVALTGSDRFDRAPDFWPTPANEDSAKTMCARMQRAALLAMSEAEIDRAVVEAMCRAMCEARGADPDIALAINNTRDDGGPEPDVAMPYWRNYESAARAAIRAALRKMAEG